MHSRHCTGVAAFRPSRRADTPRSVRRPAARLAAEAAEFVAACRAVSLPRAGFMVEVPAAALRGPAIAEVVDLLSIGTNELSQYAFAADRQCGELADRLDPWQPVLLELIAACAEAGRAAGKPVGVCGEAAADPALSLVLTGLGVSSLSMAARSIPAVREAPAAHTVTQCRRIAEAGRAAPDGSSADTAVAALRRT